MRFGRFGSVTARGGRPGGEHVLRQGGDHSRKGRGGIARALTPVFRRPRSPAPGVSFRQ